MTDNVNIYSAPKPFSLLTPGRHPARTGDRFGVILDRKNSESPPEELLDAIRNSRIVAIDFETRGTDPTLPDNYIVGCGLAGDDFSVYIPISNGLIPYELLDVLRNHTGIIAHNWYFDGQWLEYSFPGHVRAHLCTYLTYKMLATEGWPGQKWSLKESQLDLLGWTETNEAGLDNWLVQNGHHKQNMAPLKGEMWRAPVEILGHYCILDADSTYLLYTRVLEPVLRKYPETSEYLTGPFMTLLQALIEQRLLGMVVDLDKMRNTAQEMRHKLAECDITIESLPEVQKAREDFFQEALRQFDETEPARYKKFDMGQEPVKYKKPRKSMEWEITLFTQWSIQHGLGTTSMAIVDADGESAVVHVNGTTQEVTQSWKGWKRKQDAGPIQSKNWENWAERRRVIVARENPDYQFNIRSGDQLRWLLFERLGFEPLDFTESGLPSVSTDVIGAYGVLGKALVERSELEKQLSYVDAYIELAAGRRTSTLHPSFRVPGTLTGRLSGREPNLQQMPKLKSVMGAIVARPGHVLVDLDFAALETVVAAELTRDKALMALYEDPKKQNDIYLFTGAHIEAFSAAILGCGYDPNKPTPEGLAAAKKLCKRERSICKTVVLAKQYGAGAKKIHKTLTMNGVDIALWEVEEICQAYDALYSGIKRFQKKLEDEYRVRGGYIMNGIGRPIGVHKDYVKDLFNRTCQSTGHDILVMYYDYVVTELRKNEIPFTPFIADFHDAVTIETPEQYGEEVARVMEYCVDLLNQRFGNSCPLRGKAVVGRNLAEVKEPER